MKIDKILLRFGSCEPTAAALSMSVLIKKLRRKDERKPILAIVASISMPPAPSLAGDKKGPRQVLDRDYLSLPALARPLWLAHKAVQTCP